MIIQTARLHIRSFSEEDFTSFYSLLSDKRAMRYTLWDALQSERDARRLFGMFREADIAAGKPGELGLAVTQRETGSFVGIGIIDLIVYSKSGGCAEIGYILHPDHWGKGYATELAKALVDCCFTDLGLHKVIACCNANNTASEHVMQKLGMEIEGRFRQMRFKHGRWDDELRYTLLRERSS